MSSNPRHGTKPLAAKIRLACDWGSGSGITIWNIRSRAPGGVWKSTQCVGSGAAEELADSLRAEGKEATVNRL